MAEGSPTGRGQNRWQFRSDDREAHLLWAGWATLSLRGALAPSITTSADRQPLGEASGTQGERLETSHEQMRHYLRFKFTKSTMHKRKPTKLQPSVPRWLGRVLYP